VVCGIHVRIHLEAGLLEGNVALNAPGADAALSRLQRALNHGLE
jgi:hypothetical protein